MSEVAAGHAVSLDHKFELYSARFEKALGDFWRKTDMI